MRSNFEYQYRERIHYSWYSIISAIVYLSFLVCSNYYIRFSEPPDPFHKVAPIMPSPKYQFEDDDWTDVCWIYDGVVYCEDNIT